MILLLAPRELAGWMSQTQTVKSAAKSAIGMAEMLAHEIKNPLAGITGAAQLLSMGLDPKDLELTDLIVEETRRIVKLLEQVDAIQKIVLRAERRCQKRLSGKVPYAPNEVQHFGRLINFWNMVMGKKCNKIISSKRIKRKAKKLNITDYMLHSIDAIQRMRATAWSDYKKAKPTAK